MDNLSAAAQQVIDTLTAIGEGTAADIREKIGKAKSTTDKAIREIADAGLIAATHPDDGTPTRWSLATPATGPAQDTAAPPNPVSAYDLTCRSAYELTCR